MRQNIVGILLSLSILLAGCSGVEKNILAGQGEVSTRSVPLTKKPVINPIRQAVINSPPTWDTSNIALSAAEVGARFQMIIYARSQMEEYLPDYLAAGFNGTAYIYLSARTSAGPQGLDSVQAQQTLCDPARRQLAVWSNSPTMDAGDFCEIHDAIIQGSALAEYPDLHPTEGWFLHKWDNSRIAYGHAGDGATYYVMNPDNAGWRTYFSRRALREVVSTDPKHLPVAGVTGIFIDNLNSTYYFLMELNNGLPSREFPLKPGYDKALAGLVSDLHQTLSAYGKPLLGNLSDMDTPAVWDLFLPNLDAVESETWITDWGYGLPSPSRMENELLLTEKILAQGKVFLGVAQGSSAGNYNKFVLGCFLLVTDGENAFYRYKNYNGDFQEYYEIPEYSFELGEPLTPSQKLSDNPLIYQRLFKCGRVAVNLTAGNADIVVSACNAD